MQAFWMMGTEVEDPPVLLDVGFRIGFKAMDDIWEFHCITDKKDGEIVSHYIKVTLPGVELHSKTSRIPNGFRAATLMDNCRETDNDRCLNSRCPEEISTSKVRNIMGDLKEALGTSSPSMDNTFWDPFPLKIGKLLYQMIILKKDWTSGPNC